MAQIERAILFTSAMATNINGFRSIIRWRHAQLAPLAARPIV